MKFTLPGKRKPYLMAHRGNSAACPENTRAAFERALAEGADIIETDIHVTADGEFACIHDATVDRTTDGHGAVAEMTLAEIQRLSAHYDRPEFAGERVLALEELLPLIPADGALAVELKCDRFLEPEVGRRLAAVIAAAGASDRCITISFSLARLRAVQAVAPEIPVGWITLSRCFPRAGVQVHGPFWPLLALNPLYGWLVHRRGEIVCPLDPTPLKRLWLYYFHRCDVILANDTAAVRAAMSRRPTWL